MPPVPPRPAGAEPAAEPGVQGTTTEPHMTDPDLHDLPEPERKPRHRWSFSLIWLVPIAAAIAGLVLVVRTYLEAGPTISISFETAEGLEAGKTEVRYKN